MGEEAEPMDENLGALPSTATAHAQGLTEHIFNPGAFGSSRWAGPRSRAARKNLPHAEIARTILQQLSASSHPDEASETGA